MLFPNKREYIGIGIGISQNELKNICISDIGKNPISCIPNKYIYIYIYIYIIFFLLFLFFFIDQ